MGQLTIAKLGFDFGQRARAEYGRGHSSEVQLHFSMVRANANFAALLIGSPPSVVSQACSFNGPDRLRLGTPSTVLSSRPYEVAAVSSSPMGRRVRDEKSRLAVENVQTQGV
jgi:hypothetical protein